MTEYGIDRANMDGRMGRTAVLLDWPEKFSGKAKWAIRYLADTGFLFRYMGYYIVTDEGLELTDSKITKPNGIIMVGGPRGTFKSLEEVEHWLETVTDDWKDECPELGDY